MSNSKPREAGPGRKVPIPGEARREGEPPPGEMPEWLATELFKIFV